MCLMLAFSLFTKETSAAASTTEQKIEVISPSGKGGEEQFKRGEKIYYTYTLTKNSKKLEVSLYGGPKDETVYKVKRYDGWGLNKKVIASKDTAKLVPGQYGLLICDYTENKNDPVCDSSDGVITITDDSPVDVATSTPKEQKIEIKSPNGGEQFYKGESINYNYKLAKNTKNLLIELVDADKNTVGYTAKRYDGWGDNRKVISKEETKKIPGGMYILRICDTSTRVPVCDVSDGRITIVDKLPISEILAPVLTKVQAKAANDNELFATETAVLYGKNIIKEYTKVYLVLNDGQKKFFSTRDLNTTSMTVSTFERGILADGTYKLYAVNGEKVSNPLTINYKNPTASVIPTIKIIYPNGGEVLGLGVKDVDFRTTWSASNLIGDVEVYVHFDDGGTCFLGRTQVTSGVFTKKLGANYKCPNLPRTLIDGDKYRVSIYADNGDSDVDFVVKDSSDNYFTIQNFSNEILENPNQDQDQQEQDNDLQGVIKNTDSTPQKILGAPTDACKNLPGDQAGIPSGYTNTGVKVSGNCKKIGALDEFSEPIKQEEKKNQEQKIEKVCQVIRDNIPEEKRKLDASWRNVKCDSDVFENTKKKDRRTQTKNVEKGTQSASEASYPVVIELESGSTHEFVKTLQKYLNSNGYIVNEILGEVGSIGYETDYFGEKTKQALIKFQKDKGITPAQGYFGPKTRAVMGI